ncbi:MULTISPECIES: fatty acid oxidation complex subunit alpha FadB [Spongiibacter]|uniref:fatty acid oxidation complex subunit alpha FadB n=1 Tax=Spongiibacter TaxID=630749 RepID=UPI000C634F49|nr:MULTISPECIES: fatty acid oxidation complex subunit alpha FadB [Spongiibacter]MAY37479.1 fatty acid oxidation complex subunit alpha FadB [Spongiibacter sp.]MBI59465.1 fatty acid oxidation complex subunit alpha FadB [Spongiibacter sp.]MBO6751742.1 fatty acid oxidation complex subunit alpha FadB [Spongiibacter sp.]|tara:strand:- start:357 stop:2504 length:2148 start_codon:yes stop_codon:yes gene_type:complete
MIYQGKALSASFLEDGIAELCFDLQGDSVNKFNRLTLEELGEATQALASESGLKGVVVTSGKPVFIVGADITEFTELFTLPDAELRGWLEQANAIFNAFEDLPVPTVAAINGVALGGGYEMCLACDFRVMSSAAVVGLPEVKLGINPGFGGTVRLPRVIGCDNANLWVATGNQQKPDAALKDGGVDAVVAPELLKDAAVDLLKKTLAGEFDYQARREEKMSPVKLNDIERMMAFTTGKAMVAQQAGKNMPAPVTAVKSMERNATLSRDEAIEVEIEHFIKLARTPQADALVGLFLNEQGVSKTARTIAKQGGDVKQGAVLGAGIMGGGIAYQSAYKGTPILMKDIAEAGLELGMKEAGKLLSKRVARGRMTPDKMAAVLSSIRPTLSYDGFDKADVIVEAVVENPKVKHAVLAETEKHIREDAVLASNTSTISISYLAEALERPENFCGMHFFNPVHAMPLVEVIRGEKTSETTVARTVKYALQMGKTPIVVNDCPGFFVNRVLFPYFAGFDMLVRDGADFRHVDKVMERFGMPMGPAYLMDVVGIDTGFHAAEVMAEGFPDRMRHPFKGISQMMFEANRYGQKNGIGFYKYEEDKRGKPKKTEDETALSMAAEAKMNSVELSDDDILARMMIPMCIETVRCLDESIVGSAADADMGLIMGIGFPVFRGGAMRYIDQMGVKAFVEMADRYADLGKLYQVTDSLREMAAKGESFFK